MATQLTPDSSGRISSEPAATKAKLTRKNFANADEVRDFPLGKVELLNFDGAVVGRFTLQPGWRWTQSVRPIAKTDNCEAAHFQYHISGTLRIKMKDGSEVDCKAGDISSVPPGHDAWVVGNEPVVVVDFKGMGNFAKEPHTH
ncbi:MAG: cupin domain-containing protein [Bdellovibrio sp.]